MAKIVNGILILRKANSTAWTRELDTQMVNWTNTYIQWIETWPTAIQESRSPKYVACLLHERLLMTTPKQPRIFLLFSTVLAQDSRR
jgi:hypothetical protein